VHQIFSTAAVKAWPKRPGALLGRIPIDPEVARSVDDGDVYLAVAEKARPPRRSVRHRGRETPCGGKPCQADSKNKP
jgi:hypothetical protein